MVSMMDKQQIPAGYKQSEVGVIPEDWWVNDIGHFNPFVTSGSRGWAEYYSEMGDLFVRITNMRRSSIYLDLTNNKYVSLPSLLAEGKRTELINGDVLISITADVGISGYVDDTVAKPAYINQHVALVRFTDDEVDSKFVSYYLASENIQKLFRGRTDQGAKAGINLSGIRAINFAVPPKKEQTAIANALSDVDALIAALEKLIDKKTAIKTATMQQLLTGKKRLPPFDQLGVGYQQTELGEIPKDWEVVKFGEVLKEFRNGYSFSAQGYIKDGTPIITMSQIGLSGQFQFDLNKVNRWDIVQFNKLKEFWVNDGNLLIAMTDVTPEKNLIGQMTIAKLSQTSLLNQRVGLLRLDDLKAEVNFFSYLSCLPLWKSYCRGVASLGVQANIGTTDIKKALVPLPSQKEQTAIANVLSDMDTELDALQQRLAKTQHIKQGMMQELLTGKTRLVTV